MRINLDVGSFGKFVLDASPTNTIQSIRLKIEDELGIPPSEQNILFGGSHLEGNQFLQAYQINDGCTIRCYWLSTDGTRRLGFDNDSYISGQYRNIQSRRFLGEPQSRDTQDSASPTSKFTPSPQNPAPPQSWTAEGLPSTIRHEFAIDPAPPLRLNTHCSPGQAPSRPIERRTRSYESPANTQGYHCSLAPNTDDAEDKELAEAIAASILGEFIDAPSVRIIEDVEGTRMNRHQWEAIREVLESDQRARTDIACLARLLEDRQATS